MSRLVSVVAVSVFLFALGGCGKTSSQSNQSLEKQVVAVSPVQNSSEAKAESDQKKVPFSDVFQSNQDGSVSPKMAVSVNGITMTPGVSFTAGTSFGGLDIAAAKGKPLLVEQHEGFVLIKGVAE